MGGGSGWRGWCAAVRRWLLLLLLLLLLDKYPFYHIYHGPRTTGRKHNDMNAAKQGGNGGGWGMKGQAAPAVLCQGGCCAPAPRQGAPLDAADCTCQKCDCT